MSCIVGILLRVVVRHYYVMLEVPGGKVREGRKQRRANATYNAICRPDADVARRGSRGRILVIPTREDVSMLREVIQVLGGTR